MALFDILSPAVESLFARTEALGIPEWLPVLMLGAMSAIATMLIYRTVSNQAQLAGLASSARALRQALGHYDGEFSGLQRLIGQAAKVSGRQLWGHGWPAILASLPILFVVAPLSNLLEYELPRAGDIVALRLEPAVPASPQSFAWPTQPDIINVELPGSRCPVPVTPASRVPIVEHWSAINYLFANPSGYLPAGCPVEQVRFELRERDLHAFGPAVVRRWWFAYFLSLFLVSFALKLRWKIH